MIKYIIKETLFYDRYYCKDSMKFVGISFATLFMSNQDAKSIIYEKLPPGYYQIIKIYKK